MINRISRDAWGGLALVVSTILALICSNSSLSPYYEFFLDIPVSVNVADFSLSKPLLHWINDGLMVIFFMYIGMHVKRECLVGHFTEIRQAMLPIVAAVGGMVIPALIYLLFTYDNQLHMHGWAIPVATDIAFSLGILAFFSERIPFTLKLFLMTLATVDDLGAILIIAVFHTAHLSAYSLGLASLFTVILFGLNKFKIDSLAYYIFFGLALWVAVLKSGVHATLSGVVIACAIPLMRNNGQKMLGQLIHDLQPFVSFIIMPLFAFANAGVPLSGFSTGHFTHPVMIGIIFGLVMGKSIGIVTFSTVLKKWLALKNDYPNLQLTGVALLCGIGFTLSLFIATLAFGSKPDLLDISRLAILIGSGLSAIIGVTVLFVSTRVTLCVLKSGSSRP